MDFSFITDVNYRSSCYIKLKSVTDKWKWTSHQLCGQLSAAIAMCNNSTFPTLTETVGQPLGAPCAPLSNQGDIALA